MGQATKSPSGILGWVVAAFMAVIALGQCAPNRGAPLTDPPSVPRYVQARVLNCRSEPSEAGAVSRSLARNDLVNVLEEATGWARIEGTPECWVSTRFLATAPSEVPDSPPRAHSLLSSSFGSGETLEEKPTARPRRTTIRSSASAYYPNCAAARAAGAAPVRAGDPGYSRRLDRDGDGVGCE